MANRALRACLTGLVLVNLLFVQLTEAIRGPWLLVLYALTILGPLFASLRERFLYRAVWNLGVLGVFGLLVHHASGYDLRYVLEDGLVLAALCQVHLLNNLGSNQRPDLLFLNSFLIATVTGYMCQDLAFAAACGVYAPLLIVGLCLFGVTEGNRALEAHCVRRVAADGLARAGVLVTCTLLAFVLWPRDFQRPGLLESHLELTTGSGQEAAFDDSLSLARRGRVEASDELVMRVRLEAGDADDVPVLWRGATLISTNGDQWWPFADGDPGREQASDASWRRSGRELVRGAGAGAAVRVGVESLDGSSGRLFTPLSAERLAFEAGGGPGPVVGRADGTLEFGEPGQAHPPVRYRLGLGARASEGLGGPIPEGLEAELDPFVDLPDSDRIRAAVDLAGRLALESPGSAQHELVAHFSDHLSSAYAYLPPGAVGAAGSLDEFLRGGAGHCEFFASALATMLRSRGVPCRVVTGYRSTEWDAERRVLTFRRRHAHAWVEVRDPQAGWYAVDPNPAPALDQGPSALARLRIRLGAAWEQLTAFDAERRAGLMTLARELPARVLAALRARPLAVLGGLGLVALVLAALRARRRRRADPVLRDYARALRGVGLALGPGETPRELLERAGSLEVAPERVAALRRATQAHEAARYSERARAL